MTRLELVKRLAEFSTRPLNDFSGDTSTAHAAQTMTPMHQPVQVPMPALDAARPSDVLSADADANADGAYASDLFVWFEDTTGRQRDGRCGIAGLPESLLPYPADTNKGLRIIERRYSEGHLHLLSAVRLRCTDRIGERIAAIYTSALSVGTIAWIGTGRQYEQAWKEMYPYGA